MMVDLDSFTPLAALAGGALIGLSASVMLLLNGRVAGVSGIVGGCLTPMRGEGAWRATFVAGLLAGGMLLMMVAPQTISFALDRSIPALALAGLLVGFGTRLGSGCTSGHGVCGLSRGSIRSLVATLTFMAAGFATAAVVTHVFGGSL